MIISNIPGLSSMSMVKAKVDLYNGSTLVKTCTCGDVLSDFTVTREGDNSKFFGFGICHKLDVNLIDLNRELLSVTAGNTAEIGLGDGTLWDAPYPTFYIQELQRDEKANTIKATAYDKLYEVSEYSFDDLGLVTPYCFVDIAQAIATKLGLTLNIDANIYSAFRVSCLEDPNLDEASTKDLRTVLNWIAEATQSIYFVNHNNELAFRRLDRDGEAVAHITQNDYYELDTKTPKTLKGICSTTELDNLEASVEGEGITQYIRSNPFIELREDLATILDNGIAALGGITVAQFDCDWVGNYLLEVGDKLALTVEDGTEVYSYLLSDSVTYAGTLNEVSGWEYTEQKTDTFSNPTNIGEKINQTFAKVDKVNKKIELLVSDVDEAKESIASLTMTTEAINLKVTEHEEKIEAFEELETGQIVDRMAQIEIDLDGIEASVSSHTTQIQANTDEVAGVKQTTTSNTTRLSAIEANLDSINLSVSNQSSKITNLETTTSNQSAQISGLENTATTQGTLINELSDVVDTNTTNISNVTKTTEEHTDKIGKIEVSLNGIDLTVKNQDSKITTLEGTTKNQGEALNDLTDEVSDNATQISNVKKTTEEHTTKIGQIEVDLDSIDLRVSNQASKITTLETTTSNQGTALDELSDEVETNTTNIGKVTKTTEEHTEQIGQIEVDLNSIGLTVSNQSSKITTLETTTQTQGTAISGLTTTTTNQGNAISDLTADVAENAAGISTLTETTEEHTEKIGKIEVDLNSIDLSVQNQTTKITTLETKTGNHDTAIEDLTDDVEANTSNINTLTTTTTTHTNQISALQLKADSITATVTNLTEDSRISTENFEYQLEQLTQEVSTKITAEDLSIAVKNVVDDGVTKVETSTGFIFDSEGLTIEKSGREMKTQITEDGMTVYRDTTAVLTADNTGVDAKNLKASTYLVIGTNSRFENYGTTRTACFWIGD